MAYYASMAAVPAKLPDPLRAMGRPGRELALLLLGLGLGMFVMPLLTWTAGMFALGPYENGGFGALLADFLRGLADGSLACWMLLAGPYVLIWVFRLLRRALAAAAARDPE